MGSGRDNRAVHEDARAVRTCSGRLSPAGGQELPENLEAFSVRHAWSLAKSCSQGTPPGCPNDQLASGMLAWDLLGN